jgi:hypothetical protein
LYLGSLRSRIPVAIDHGSRPEFFFGAATRGRSRPDIFSGSRPVVGRDRIFILGRDPWSVVTGFFFLGRDRFLNFWVATGSGRDPRVDGPQHYSNVNVILQTFQTVCLVQYDLCIPFTVPDPRRSRTPRNVQVERNNALELIVENVHGTVTVRSRSLFKNERITVI